MQLSEVDLATLQELEESMWIAATRFDVAYMERTLSPEFFEFGCSGRVYTRAQIIGVEAKAEIRAKLPLRDFQVRSVTADVVQVTYISEVLYREGTQDVAQVCNRSSLWLRTAQGWQLRFHKGTPVWQGE